MEGIEKINNSVHSVALEQWVSKAYRFSCKRLIANLGDNFPNDIYTEEIFFIDNGNAAIKFLSSSKHFS